jgi:5-oxoprolinase (ATP-hydrolysing) subunit B
MLKLVAVSDRAIELDLAGGESGHAVDASTSAQWVAMLSSHALTRGWPTCQWVQADGTVCVVFSRPFHDEAELQTIMNDLQLCLNNLSVSDPPKTGIEAPARQHVIEVAYGGVVGQDLQALAKQLEMTPDEFISIHSQAVYEVSFLGFLPGFAYLKGLDSRLVLPRRETPRAHVPAGALAIASEYCAIYPWQSPGGWHLIGRVDVQLFDVNAIEQAALFKPGDTVRFVQVNRA